MHCWLPTVRGTTKIAIRDQAKAQLAIVRRAKESMSLQHTAKQNSQRRDGYETAVAVNLLCFQHWVPPDSTKAPSAGNQPFMAQTRQSNLSGASLAAINEWAGQLHNVTFLLVPQWLYQQMHADTGPQKTVSSGWSSIHLFPTMYVFLLICLILLVNYASCHLLTKHRMRTWSFCQFDPAAPGSCRTPMGCLQTICESPCAGSALCSADRYLASKIRLQVANYSTEQMRPETHKATCLRKRVQQGLLQGACARGTHATASETGSTPLLQM